MIEPEAIRSLVAEHTESASSDATRYRYERSAVREIEASLLRPQADRLAVLLDGPRHTGKSVALRQLTARLRAADPSGAHYCDLTDVRLRGVGIQALVQALVPQGQDAERPRFLLLDEVHYGGDDWARQLKFAVDNFAARIAIADSAVALVRSSVSQELVGRTRDVRMHPLTFTEWRGLRRHHGLPVAEKEDETGLLRECHTYLEFGGFPAYAANDDLRAVYEHLRGQVVAQAAREDIATLRGLRDVDRLERLFVSRLAASGSQLSTREDAKQAAVSEPTIRHWLEALVDTGLLFRLEGYARSSGKYARMQSKLYAVDPSLIGACSVPVFGPASANLLGRQAESAVAQALRVFCEERPNARLSFHHVKDSGPGRPGEIDFVVEDDQELYAIEVTAHHDRGKLSALARRASALGAGRTAVVSLRTRAEVANVGQSEIHLVPLHELLLRLAEGRWPW